MKTAPSVDTPLAKKRRKKADICSDKLFETTFENPHWREKDRSDPSNFCSVTWTKLYRNSWQIDWDLFHVQTSMHLPPLHMCIGMNNKAFILYIVFDCFGCDNDPFYVLTFPPLLMLIFHHWYWRWWYHAKCSPSTHRQWVVPCKMVRRHDERDQTCKPLSLPSVCVSRLQFPAFCPIPCTAQV